MDGRCTGRCDAPERISPKSFHPTTPLLTGSVHGMDRYLGEGDSFIVTSSATRADAHGAHDTHDPPARQWRGEVSLPTLSRPTARYGSRCVKRERERNFRDSRPLMGSATDHHPTTRAPSGDPSTYTHIYVCVVDLWSTRKPLFPNRLGQKGEHVESSFSPTTTPSVYVSRVVCFCHVFQLPAWVTGLCGKILVRGNNWKQCFRTGNAMFPASVRKQSGNNRKQ